MRKILYIVVVLLMCTTVGAKKKAPIVPELTEAEMRTEQQFTYYLYAAQYAWDSDDYDDALAYAEFAYRLKPNDPTICNYLGHLYQGTNRRGRAMDMYKKAYENDPVDYWYDYFYLLYTGKQTTSALQLFAKESKLQPKNLELQQTYMRVLLHEQNYKKALKVLDVVEKLEGRNSDHIEQRYEILTSLGKRKKAIKLVDDYIKEEPDNYELKLARGVIYQENGEDSLALATYLDICEKDPTYAYAYYTLSNYYQAHGDIVKAREAFTPLIDIYSNDQILDSYYDMLQKDTTVTDSMRNEFIQKAYLLSPNNAKWHYFWASVLREQHQDSLAMNICKAGISLSKEESNKVFQFPLMLLLGDIYAQQEEMDSCFLYYERALKLNPNSIYLLNNYAWQLATHGGNLKKAEKMSQKTIEVEPKNPSYLDTYAWILHLQGQDKLAQFYMRRALDNLTDENAEQIEEFNEHYKAIFGEKTNE